MDSAEKKSVKTIDVKRFLLVWEGLRDTLSIDKKDRIGLLYVSEVLGLRDGIAQLFKDGNGDAYHKVGMKQSSLTANKESLRIFWQKIEEILPEIHTKEDIDFLVITGGIPAISSFLFELEPPGEKEKSPVLHKLAINAHVYK